jgi:anaerobic selenocysteine-containing dehydrogenase
VEPLVETRKSFCRFCHVVCGIEVDAENGRPVAVRGTRIIPSREATCA